MSFCPIVIILISSIFFAIWGLLNWDFNRSFRITNAACILVAFFLIYPNMINTIFVSFSCEKIDDTLYLEIDMSEECWTGDHSFYVMCVSIPALIIWGIGMPAYAMVRLRGHYKRGAIFNKEVLSKFGFLYNGYKTDRYYWELTILYRKCLIVFILVFFSLISI